MKKETFTVFIKQTILIVLVCCFSLIAQAEKRYYFVRGGELPGEAGLTTVDLRPDKGYGTISINSGAKLVQNTNYDYRYYEKVGINETGWWSFDQSYTNSPDLSDIATLADWYLVIKMSTTTATNPINIILNNTGGTTNCFKITTDSLRRDGSWKTFALKLSTYPDALTYSSSMSSGAFTMHGENWTAGSMLAIDYAYLTNDPTETDEGTVPAVLPIRYYLQTNDQTPASSANYDKIDYNTNIDYLTNTVGWTALSNATYPYFTMTNTDASFTMQTTTENVAFDDVDDTWYLKTKIKTNTTGAIKLTVYDCNNNAYTYTIPSSSYASGVWSAVNIPLSVFTGSGTALYDCTKFSGNNILKVEVTGGSIDDVFYMGYAFITNESDMTLSDPDPLEFIDPAKENYIYFVNDGSDLPSGNNILSLDYRVGISNNVELDIYIQYNWHNEYWQTYDPTLTQVNSYDYLYFETTSQNSYRFNIKAINNGIDLSGVTSDWYLNLKMKIEPNTRPINPYLYPQGQETGAGLITADMLPSGETSWVELEIPLSSYGNNLSFGKYISGNIFSLQSGHDGTSGQVVAIESMYLTNVKKTNELIEAPFFHDLDVISIYSDDYTPADSQTNISSTDWEEVKIEDNDVLLVKSGSSGVVFDLSTSADIAHMESLHFNIKSDAACNDMIVGIKINEVWYDVAIGSLTADAWYSKTISLSNFNLSTPYDIAAVRFTNAGESLSSGVYIDNVFFYTPSAMWSPQGSSTNWSDPNNWKYNIPAASLNVAIPKSVSYPILTGSETITASINSIAFAPGAEIGNQQYLNLIEPAYIKYKLASGRWHILASPVTTTAEDFHLNGEPDVWFRKFTPTSDKAGWTYFQELGTTLTPGEGFSYWITASAGAQTVTVQGELAESNELQTINFSPGGNTYGSYFALAGNPFMTSIDFTALRTETKNTGIKKNFLIYTKDGFKGYTTVGSWGSVSGSSTINEFIAPLQAFFVEREDLSSSNDVTLEFDLADAATGSGELRTAKTSIPKLDIIANNGTVPVLTFIAESENAHSARKLKNGAGSIPDIYTLAQDKTTALGAQIISTNNITVPLGILTSYSGDITLTFNGIDTFGDTEIKLLDTIDDTEVTLSNDTKTYTFMHTPQEVIGEDESGKETKSILPTENRLFIAFSPTVVTGIADASMQHISVYYKNNVLYASSTANDLIKQIYVYDVQGRLIYANESINAPDYLVGMQRKEGDMFVVKLITENNVKNVKVASK